MKLSDLPAEGWKNTQILKIKVCLTPAALLSELPGWQQGSLVTRLVMSSVSCAGSGG